jgi:hypothetical protein
MQQKIYLCAFFLCVLFSYQSFGQNVRERAQNIKQITEGKKNLNRDIQELKEIKATVALFNRAFDSKNLTEVKATKLKLVENFRREIRQSEEKAVKARREVHQSSREVRTDRRELRRGRNGAPTGSMARDRVNKRDDKRDRRDDKRDLEQQIKRAEQQKSILNGLINFEFGFKGNLLEKSIAQKTFIGNFIKTMEADIVATKREIGEDVREAGEDRRETKDDRRRW